MTSARTGPADLGTGDLADLFRASYPGMVRLAGLLGADDPEDIAQEAFARLMQKAPPPDDPAPYLRTIVCNLTRNRHRHLRVARSRTLPGLAELGVPEPSTEHTAILREDHAEVVAALATLPPRRREAIVLRYWLDLSEREIAQTMGVPAGTVKSHVSRGMAALAQVLEAKA
jgi:RNA polymerase sigma factor (sigma-70 family)